MARSLSIQSFHVGAALALAAALHGCTASSDDASEGDALTYEHEHVHDAGPTAPALSLAGSKLGRSGGFVDFDGEGALDMLVGAPHAQLEDALGVALVYAGQDDGWPSEPTATLHADRDFGFSFANLGDVDGDGRADYAIGAPHGDSASGALTGSVHVYAAGSRGHELATLGGATPAAKLGYAITGGDFNGDGAADVAVGAPYHTPEPALYQAGAVFVYFGPDLRRQHALLATSTNKGLGWALASGDVNADGIDDLLLALKPASGGGKVHAYFGGAGFSPALDTPDRALSSLATGFGSALAVLDDLDGDGARDLAIGAPNATVAELRDTGSVYLVSTPADATPVDVDADPAPAQRIARIDGPGLFSRFGAALGVAREADGRDALVIGAPLADDRDDDMVGKAFVLARADLGASTTLTDATQLAGQVAFGSFGSLIAGYGDGRVLVGAPRARADTGAVYVVDLASGGVVEPGVTGETSSDHHEHDAP